MAKIAAVIIDDTHTDLDVQVFASADEALFEARKFIQEAEGYGERFTYYESKAPSNRLLYATYGCDSSSVMAQMVPFHE